MSKIVHAFRVNRVGATKEFSPRLSCRNLKKFLLSLIA